MESSFSRAGPARGGKAPVFTIRQFGRLRGRGNGPGGLRVLIASIRLFAKQLKESHRQLGKLCQLLAGPGSCEDGSTEPQQEQAQRAVAILQSLPGTGRIVLAVLLAEARRSPAAAPRQEDVMRSLRRMKAEAALLIALADIGGAWPVARVTQALTEVAGAPSAHTRVVDRREDASVAS